jgi:transcriptional regulator with XRE-family HTH domain
VDPLDDAAAAAMNQAGQQIRCLRDQSGRSVDELALRSGLPVEILRAVEIGHADIGLGELSRLAAVLGVPLSALVS